MARVAVAKRRQLLDGRRHRVRKARHRRPVTGAARQNDRATPDLTGARDHVVAVVGRPHRGDVRPGPHAAECGSGKALDQLDDLGHRHVAIGIRALVANARQATLPVGSEQPQRVPALVPPGVRHLAPLEHHVVDRPLGQKVAGGEAGMPGADDDGGEALDGEVPQRPTARTLRRP